MNIIYENYEFDLVEFRPSQISENGLRYEIYEYVGKLKLPGKRIILYFNADILMKVEIIIE
ncbi:hypothetical protein [Apibacter adventoris]|uniref:Uncharacterized protein n=1 Tax=Apibacter adventoris TaxID=1679466 RepID=A0A2S8A854_9FLAO|nr:hypothetical protein [Apibacter adventoris]PQL90755.1 hypothetical protein C4S77_09875 [Apibacter adventoris]